MGDPGCLLTMLVMIGLTIFGAIFSDDFRTLLLGVFGFLAALTAIILTSEFLRATSWHPWQWLRAKLGWGKSLNTLAKRLETSPQWLRNFTPSYRPHAIPKRSGGMRELQIPDAPTMEMQHKVLKRVLFGLRSHKAAMGFQRGCSIVHNAQPHVRQEVLIKLDVMDFFPSTSEKRIQQYFQRIGWNREAASVLTKLVTYEGGLPQGAPTSPRMSNLVNYLLDVRLQRIAERRHGTYTRYADDITISFPGDYPKKVRGTIQLAGRQLKALGYQLHHRKTRILRRHQRQSVTGLNVNTKVSLPRELRRKLRAARHRLEQGQDATWTAEQLEGYAALESMIREQSKEWNAKSSCSGRNGQ